MLWKIPAISGYKSMIPGGTPETSGNHRGEDVFMSCGNRAPQWFRTKQINKKKSRPFNIAQIVKDIETLPHGPMMFPLFSLGRAILVEFEMPSFDVRRLFCCFSGICGDGVEDWLQLLQHLCETHLPLLLHRLAVTSWAMNGHGS